MTEESPDREARSEASTARVVADADVLAADLLVGGFAREALDHVRRHDWLTLLSSESLLDEVEAVVTELGDPDLAAAHRERLRTTTERVEHPEEDHPALASAYRGEAAHLLSYDESLRSPETGLSIQPHANLSVRPPDAFARLFDPASLYDVVVGGEYPGPDRDPRA
jgi:predicted nucleic acid-binding protein